MGNVSQGDRIDISVVIPVFNERESLVILADELIGVMAPLGRAYEVIMVDDGSSDGSGEVIRTLAESHGSIIGVILSRHTGKSTALAAGFEEARGDIVITMDADLQDLPAEIPRFLAELEKGYDMVSGWKENRRDPIGKTLPSKLFNHIVSRVTGVALHDHNCGFKAYRREVVQDLPLYGELHRFMAVHADAQGYRVGEIPVMHRQRRYGRSKYGVGRLLNGLLDLLTVIMTVLFESRPLHVFGKLGLLFLVVGGGACAYLTVLWLIGERPIGTRPLLSFGIMAILFGMQCLSFGLLAEIIIKGQKRRKPRVRKIVR